MYIQLQITYPTYEEAQESVSFLVSSKLAACAQLIEGIESRYVWQGESYAKTETLLLCKTRAELFNRVVAEISARHSYQCPQIVGVELSLISSDYEAWLDDCLLKE